jgi:hypothetical protein
VFNSYFFCWAFNLCSGILYDSAFTVADTGWRTPSNFLSLVHWFKASYLLMFRLKTVPRSKRRVKNLLIISSWICLCDSICGSTANHKNTHYHPSRPMAHQSLVGQGLRIIEISRSHSITHNHTPLDDWSARRRDLHPTTHDTHNREMSIYPMGFEPAIPASPRPQPHGLDRAATGIGWKSFCFIILWNMLGPTQNMCKGSAWNL